MADSEPGPIEEEAPASKSLDTVGSETISDSEPRHVEEAPPASKSTEWVPGAGESKPDEHDLASRENTPVQREVTRSSPAIRPSSVNSCQSGTSSGGPAIRTTTTSRRGGRIRSRSPPAMTSRSPGDRDFQTVESTGAENRSHSPKNPSSAAAAAAAAAKALSNSGRSQSGRNESSRRDCHVENPRYHVGYDNSSYGDSHGWPSEEVVGERRGYGSEAQYPQPIHRGGPYEQDPRGYGDGHYRSRRRHPDHQVLYDGRADYEGGRYVYGENTHGGRSFDRGAYVQDHRSSHIHDARQDYYNDPGGMPPFDNPPGDDRTMPLSYKSPTRASGPHDTETPATVKRKGGTSRVIGTPTPIHVPRAADPPPSQFSGGPSSRFSQQGNAATVFRGRPDEVAAAGAPSIDDNTPQKILLSLRTPTTSFEDQNKKSAPPLSPEEPPKIQHAHHQLGAVQPLFEPARSPRSDGAAIDLMPSFLFNTSFDSLGETGNYMLDGSQSFGPGLTGSGDNDNPVPLLPSPIRRDPSFGGGQGGFNQPILGASFGMSPDSSFGNGAGSGLQRRLGNTMVLGGTDDERAQSPSQLLGMYPLYPDGSQSLVQMPFGPVSGPIVDGPGRSGSFGPVMSHPYMRPFEQGPPPGIPPRVFSGVGRSYSQDFSFYPFLKRNRAAFIKCTFLLPGLKAALLESPLSNKPEDNGKSGRGKSQTGDQKVGHSMPGGALAGNGKSYLEPTPQDTAIAKRRIISSIYAFGGTITGDRSTSTQEDRGDNTNSASSIFRAKDRDMQHATVTPSSSSGTPPGNRLSSRSKAKYDELLPTRYYENDTCNRLSWEFEEIPPVGSVSDDEDENASVNTGRRDGGPANNMDGGDDPMLMISTQYLDNAKPGNASDDKKQGSPDQPKMRYRCKLCGQPKQNHTCPYQQSLQRSIGTMVYPAVNAFTANEPGMLAPALTEMNNFITSGSESVSSPDMSPDRPSPDRVRAKPPRATTPKGGTHNVTPESLRPSTRSNSPGSVSTSGGTPHRTPLRSAKRKARERSSNANPMSGGTAMVGSTPVVSLGGVQKRQHAQMSVEDQSNELLFVDAIDLKPEQFRIISPSTHHGSYTYPSLPLPYAQRKRLSDNLFALSKEVPQLTDECAVVLREAREKDVWDLAVAELMTQVVIVIHCHEADTRMEGLRQYLLTLGIAC